MRKKKKKLWNHCRFQWVLVAFEFPCSKWKQIVFSRMLTSLWLCQLTQFLMKYEICWITCTRALETVYSINNPLQVITETANSYVRQNIPCLEHCLKKLSKGLESFMVSKLNTVRERSRWSSCGMVLWGISCTPGHLMVMLAYIERSRWPSCVHLAILWSCLHV